MELNNQYREKTPEEGSYPAYQPAAKKVRQLTVEAAELVSCDPEESTVRCDTFIFDPDEAETKLGSLYLVLETINGERSEEILEAVSTAIRKEYYRETERSMFESLEEALSQANHVLSDYIEQGEVDYVDNFHASACAFSGQNLQISRVGNAELLLGRKGRLTDIGEGLSDNNLRRPHHAFTSVASGSVTESDLLVLATPQLSHLIPHDRLNQMVSSKNPAEVVSLLRSLLDDSRENTAFALLIIQFSKMPERLPAPEVPLNMPRRVNTDPQNNQPLRQSVRPRKPINTKRTFLRTLGHIITQILYFSWKFCREKVFPTIVATASWVGQKCAVIFSGTTNKAGSVYSSWRARKQQTPETDDDNLNPEEVNYSESYTTPEYTQTNEEFVYTDETSEVKESFLKRIPSISKNFVQHIPIKQPGTFLTLLPKMTKIIIVIVIVLAIVLFFGIRSLSNKSKQEASSQQFTEKISEAKAKKDSAESALIYNNTEKARQEIQTAKNLVSEAEKDKKYQAEVSSLLTSLQTLEDRIDKITRVTSPNLIGDFSTVASSLRTTAMAAIGDTIYTFDPTSNAIYKLDTKSKSASVASQTSQGIGYFRTAVPLVSEKMILFSTDTPGLAIFDAVRGDLLKQEIKFPEGVTNAKSIGVFGSRLYIMSPEKNMIYGYSKTLAGYEGGNEWVKDPQVTVNRAVGMGIDGYIYLLMDDGKIVKMLKGKPVEFKQGTLTKPVSNPTRLLIYDGLKHLYVLDPNQKRVVVYDTVGNVTNQFVFPNSKSLKDIAIGGKEEALYVLDETKVYSISLK